MMNPPWANELTPEQLRLAAKAVTLLLDRHADQAAGLTLTQRQALYAEAAGWAIIYTMLRDQGMVSAYEAIMDLPSAQRQQFFAAAFGIDRSAPEAV